MAGLEPERDVARRPNPAEILRERGHFEQRPRTVDFTCGQRYRGLLGGGLGSVGAPSREETTEKTRNSIRHGVKSEQQKPAIREVLDRRPSCKHRVDERQQDGSNKRPIQEARTTEQHQKQDKDGELEIDEVGIYILVLLRDHSAGDAACYGCNDECQDLVAIDAHADRFGGDFVRLERKKRPSKAAGEQVPQKQVRDGSERNSKPHPMQVRERNTRE